MATVSSSRRDVLISGIIGTIVLLAGFYLLTANGWPFPLSENDGVPQGFFLAFMGIVLLAATGVLTGAVSIILAPPCDFTPSVLRSWMAGAMVGVLSFLVTVAMTFIYLSGDNLSAAVEDMFTTAFSVAPLFVLIAIVVMLFSIIGGTACKLTLIAAGKIRAKKV